MPAMDTVMASFPIAGVTLVALSLIFFLRLRKYDRVPMQWGIRGKPTWSAPAWLAVSCTPALFFLVWALIDRAEPVDATREINIAALVMSASFVLAHFGHLAYAERSLRRADES